MLGCFVHPPPVRVANTAGTSLFLLSTERTVGCLRQITHQSNVGILPGLEGEKGQLDSAWQLATFATARLSLILPHTHRLSVPSLGEGHVYEV